MGDKVAISKKPNTAVSGLKAPKRTASDKIASFKASWTYPKKALSESNNARCQGVMLKWVLDTCPAESKVTSKKKTVKSKKTVDGKQKTVKSKIKVGTVTGLQANIKSYTSYDRINKTKLTEKSKQITRSDYYPYTRVDKNAIRVYKVTSAVYNSSKRTWTISGQYAKAWSMEMVNTQERGGKIFSLAALQKKPKTFKPKGVLYYVSKTNRKYLTSTYVPKPYLYGVGVTVQEWNIKSSNTKNTKKKTVDTTYKTVKWDDKVPSISAYLPFSPPAAPSVSGSIEGEGTYHKASFVIDASGDDGTSSKERCDTLYTVTLTTRLKSGGKFTEKSSNPNVKDMSGKTVAAKNVRFVTNKLSLSFNPNDLFTNRSITGLEADECVKYTVTAHNRGFAGDSSDGSASLLYALPDSSTIGKGGVTISGNRAIVKFTSPLRGTRLTTKFTLQRLANFRPSGTGTDYPVDDWSDTEWDKAAAASTGWTDVYSIHPKELAGKDHTATLADVPYAHQTDPFKRTYYRIKASNDIYGINDVFSSVAVVPGFLKNPSASNEKSSILSVTATEDAKALKAIVAFQVTRTQQGGQSIVNSNGLELSWDTASYAWESTQPASTYDFKDNEHGIWLVTSARKTAYAVLKNATLGWFYATYYIRGVTSDESYYVKARRFLKDTETRETDSYGPYADYTIGNAVATIKVTNPPKDVKLSVPERLIYGKDVSVSWTYDGEDVQKSYQLMFAQGTSDSAKANAKLLTSATESTPYCVCKWDTLVGKFMGSPPSLYLGVKVTTESGTSDLSDIKAIPIVYPPTASLGCPSVVTTLPFTITLGTSDPSSSAIVRIVSDQLSGWGPGGPDDQAEGTIVYTNKITPAWTKSEENGKTWYFANHSVSTSNLKNHGSYTVSYTAVVDDTGLDSDTIDVDGNIVSKTAKFTVDFPDQVVVPNFYVLADPMESEHGCQARICIMGTSDQKNCVGDIYRVTTEGPSLLCQDISIGEKNVTVLDPYPSYSRREPCAYRLAVRSPNGVCEWDDRSYAMPGYSIRFDWGNSESEDHGSYTHLTLPYNLEWSDSWTKNARVDLHLDGTYEGYWRNGVKRQNTLSTELVKMSGEEQIKRVISLANYAGPVLVRLPNGCEFAADVQVNNLDVSYDSLTITASFTADEIRMPNQFTFDAVTIADGLMLPSASSF